MKRIHRAIVKELALTFLLSLASLNFILMMEKLLRLSRVLSGIGTSVFDMIKIILLLQPQLFLLTIPMALLLSTLFVYARMNIDNELVILRTSGMNFWEVSKPVVVLGGLCFLINFAVSLYIGPKSSIILREEITNIIRERAPFAIEEGQFTTLFRDTVLFVKDKTDDKTMQGIFLYDNRNKNESKVLVAKQGTISTKEGLNIAFFLTDGSLNMTKGNKTTELFFRKYNLILSLEAETIPKKNAELTPAELMEKIPVIEKKRALNAYTELHRRFSLPLMCVFIIFFGPSLSLMAGKGGKLGGLTLGLAVFTFYYMMLIYGENLVRSGRLVHYIGAWFPTAVLGIFAFFMYRRERTR
ncbi:MAG: LptF/LptG family permease [Thermodesulfovibrionales bacterium]|nr:LptF/LptG family permease [Thermodesulfovibrionales bacterium]